MSPRSNRRRRESPPPTTPGLGGPERVETGPDGDWVVRRLPGSASAKAYRCPGCDQEILPGTPHVVAWPAGDTEPAVADRRHWHTPCWSARLRRGPVPQRGRAPRH